MSSDRVLVVAIEDMATAGVVAAGAAHRAIDEGVTRLVLVHVLDDHCVANGFFGFTGAPGPMVESTEEGESVLALAEAALRAEFKAMNRSAPEIDCQIGEGKAASCIAHVASEAGATEIAVGARRPHAFGRLTHPDVVGALRRHTSVPVHIVSLQAESPEPEEPSLDTPSRRTIP